MLTGPKRQNLARSASASDDKKRARFAFVVHLLTTGDLRRFDPTLNPFGDTELEALRSRISQFVKPFPLGQLSVETADGNVAEGELIVLPQLPAELLALPGNVAVDLVQSAVDLAADRGAEVVGLGGFSSIIADGGLALRRQPGLRVTSGNSLTTRRPRAPWKSLAPTTAWRSPRVWLPLLAPPARSALRSACSRRTCR
jgi:hypothetical protein